MTRRLAESHIARNHGTVDLLLEETADIIRNLLAQLRAVVIHRQQHTIDLQRRIQTPAYATHGPHEISQPLSTLAIEASHLRAIAVDAARLDDEGFVHIVDRWKDMYISGGENVYPAEVENVLFQLPQVADAAIIGVPNARWGEVGMAVIVKKSGENLEEGDVIRHCLGRLAKFKVPQSVTFVDVLPRKATGKVLKRELRTRFVGGDKPAIT